MLSISSVTTDILEEQHDKSTLGWTSDRLSSDCWTFPLTRTTLRITKSDNFLYSEIIDNHQRLHRKTIDRLRQQVRQTINSAHAGEVPKNHETLLIVICEALDLLLDFEIDQEKAEVEIRKANQNWRTDVDFDHNLLTSNEYGLDVSSIADTAHRFLEKTPAQLCEDIPPQFRVIHVESVLRRDLVSRFEAYRAKLRRALDGVPTNVFQNCMPPHSKIADNRILTKITREEAIKDMLLPRVTYHGTPLWNVSSIVRYGFKMPGSEIENGKVIASPRSNIAFDRGIYSSQAPFYALSYAMPGMQKTTIGELPALRLFVCATVMGRTMSKTSVGARHDLVHGPLVEGFDSHFDSSFEYIVHNPAAILPCYVIHLDLGSTVAKQAVASAQQNPHAYYQTQQKQKNKMHSKLDNGEIGPGDRKREAEAKKAAALKWFPNGFGSAKGTSFIIEEIGEIDDDEEEYGTWQAERHGFFRGDAGNGSWMDADSGLDGRTTFYPDVVESGNALDQYQAARRAKVKKAAKAGIRRP